MSRSAQLRDELIRIVLRRVANERMPPHANFAAELEYCDDLIDAYAAALTTELEKTELANREEGSK